MGSQSYPSLSYQHFVDNMKLILPILLTLCLMATMANAGCNQYGCCYCGSQTGIVIRTGQFAPRCISGYYCYCGYNHFSQTYYGTCDPNDNIPQVVAGGDD